MAERARILIPGGYGVFGSLLARELLAHGDVEVLIAGRSRARAEAACRTMGARAHPLRLDLRPPGALAEASAGCAAVACAAGPFQDLHPGLAADVVGVGAHWLDLADDAWVARLLGDETLHAHATEARVAVIPGVSTVPAVSGVLTRWCCDRLPSAARARITLFIGNRNPKGAAAMSSALASGFTDPVPVLTPAGPCRAYRFPSPVAALLRRDLRLDVEMRVALGWPVPARIVAVSGPLVRRLGPRARERVTKAMARVATPLGRFGSTLGSIQVEVWDGGGRSVGAALAGSGQRLAVLPCALALEGLLRGEIRTCGVVEPWSLLSVEDWIDRLRARGVRFLVRAQSSANQAWTP